MDKLLKKAMNKHKAGKNVEAAQLYKKLLKSNEWHLDGNYMLGTLYAEQGDLSAAEKYLEKAAQIKPDSQYIQTNLGNVYKSQDRNDRALLCYRRAISLQPDMVEAMNNLAVVLKQGGELEEAEALFARVLELDPGFVDARYNLANIYWDRDLHAQAAEFYQQVLDSNESHGHALDRLGDFYLESGDKEKAISFFEKYLSTNPQDELGIGLKLAYLGLTTPPTRQPGQLVIETYEKKADSWEQDVKREGMEFLGPQLVREALSQFNLAANDQRVLDLGCGTGLCAEFLQPLARRLVGVDVSHAMLSVAREKQLYDDLLALDISEFLAVNREVFDLVVASGVLIFFGDLQPVLRGIYELLAPGGKLVFSAYAGDEQDYVVRHNYHFAHSAEYIGRVAGEVGLCVQQINEVVHEYEHGKAQSGFLVLLAKPQ